VLALSAPLLTDYDPIKVNVAQAALAPSGEHWLGTDEIGRDVLTRILYGARADLMMAFFGVVGPIILGTIIGILGGYFGGRVDSILMRIFEVTVSFPYFVLVIAIVAVLGPGLRSYFISLTLVNWVSYARLVRTEALVLRNADFVLAARGMGFSHVRTMLFHVLPNALVPSAVFVMTDAVLTIVLGSSLGFLGLGVQPPTPEWGALIAEGQTYLTTAWWISVFPGIAICSLALGLSLIADGLARLLNTGT
jgi:peptide/nickel transport system permease protein